LRGPSLFSVAAPVGNPVPRPIFCAPSSALSLARQVGRFS
jgi:hypothetical protein